MSGSLLAEDTMKVVNFSVSLCGRKAPPLRARVLACDSLSPPSN